MLGTFAVTQNNPWGSLPRAYLVAPLALGAVHALEGVSAGAAWVRLGLILAPPAAGAAVTALFERFLG